MADMGFDLYLDEAVQGCIISTFLHPDDANFDFDAFYAGLADLGIVIYPGKLTEAECFRLGTIGRLFEHDMLHMLQCVRHVLGSMGVAVPVNRNRPTTTTRKAEAA